MSTTPIDPKGLPHPTANSSPSTSIQEPVKFSEGNTVWRQLSAEEKLWVIQLPDKLLEQLTEAEVLMLVRQEDSEWPQDLRQKVEPYIDLDEIE